MYFIIAGAGRRLVDPERIKNRAMQTQEVAVAVAGDAINRINVIG